jgi:hypothetical protein
MARQGAKPKPAALRLVDGTHRTTRHGDAGAVKKAATRAKKQAFGKIVMPRGLDPEGQRAWKRYIAPAWWLDISREAAAIGFIELWQAFRRRPSTFPAAQHAQMRAYMSELGLTDERNRKMDDETSDDDDLFGD